MKIWRGQGDRNWTGAADALALGLWGGAALAGVCLALSGVCPLAGWLLALCAAPLAAVHIRALRGEKRE